MKLLESCQLSPRPPGSRPARKVLAKLLIAGFTNVPAGALCYVNEQRNQSTARHEEFRQQPQVPPVGLV